MSDDPNTLVLVQNDIKYPLKHISPLAFDSIDADGQGRPTWYTYRDGNFELYYIPDQVYNVRLSYKKFYPDLVSDGDSNDFTNFAPRLIEYRTLADVLLDYREDEVRGAQYIQRAKEERVAILAETYNRTATGNLSTENIIDNDRSLYYYGFY
jgi:hypothetical protein